MMLAQELKQLFQERKGVVHSEYHIESGHSRVQVGGDLISGAKFISNIPHELAQSVSSNMRLDLKQFIVYV
jgi:uncharacterized protein (UPF0303 family)